MTPDEFAAFAEHLARAYADDQVAAGTWAPDEALDRARRGNDELLPQGAATPGMLLFTAETDGGVPVGSLWLSLTSPRGTPGCGFVYDIEVAEEHRGAGHGRALLAAGEDVLRAHGVEHLELNVFAANPTAIRLYETSGYEVVTQQMRKRL